MIASPSRSCGDDAAVPLRRPPSRCARGGCGAGTILCPGPRSGAGGPPGVTSLPGQQVPLPLLLFGLADRLVRPLQGFIRLLDDFLHLPGRLAVGRLVLVDGHDAPPVWKCPGPAARLDPPSRSSYPGEPAASAL